jgi:hypothetical protein
MCSADISTIYWQWDPIRQRFLSNANITQVCKKFEKIQDWARGHQIDEWDSLIYINELP